MESILDRFWRESGIFDVVHPLVEGVFHSWYVLPLLILSGLFVVGLLFWVTVGVQRRHLRGIPRR